MKTHNVYGKTA